MVTLVKDGLRLNMSTRCIMSTNIDSRVCHRSTCRATRHTPAELSARPAASPLGLPHKRDRVGPVSPGLALSPPATDPAIRTRRAHGYPRVRYPRDPSCPGACACVHVRAALAPLMHVQASLYKQACLHMRPRSHLSLGVCAHDCACMCVCVGALGTKATRLRAR